MKVQRLDVRQLILASLFGGASFAVRMSGLYIPLFPPIILDFRGVIALAGSCLVSPVYALIIGIFAGKLFMGMDWVGWIPACVVASYFYRHLYLWCRKYKGQVCLLAIPIGQLVGYTTFILTYVYLLRILPPLWSVLIPVLLTRAIPDLVGGIVLLKSIIPILRTKGWYLGNNYLHH